MGKFKDITVITGQYINKDGVQKNRYKTIGAIFETKKGLKLKIDFFPLIENGWSGWAELYDPKPREDHHSSDDDMEF